MNIGFRFLMILALLSFAGQSEAAGAIGTGKVGWIQTNPASGEDTFALRGVTALAACRTLAAYGSTWVFIRLKRDQVGDRTMALLMSAKAADWTLELGVDDAVTDADGYCYSRWIRVHDAVSPP